MGTSITPMIDKWNKNLAAQCKDLVFDKFFSAPVDPVLLPPAAAPRYSDGSIFTVPQDESEKQQLISELFTEAVRVWKECNIRYSHSRDLQEQILLQYESLDAQLFRNKFWKSVLSQVTERDPINDETDFTFVSGVIYLRQLAGSLRYLCDTSYKKMDFKYNPVLTLMTEYTMKKTAGASSDDVASGTHVGADTTPIAEHSSDDTGARRATFVDTEDQEVSDQYDIVLQPARKRSLSSTLSASEPDTGSVKAGHVRGVAVDVIDVVEKLVLRTINRDIRAHDGGHPLTKISRTVLVNCLLLYCVGVRSDDDSWSNGATDEAVIELGMSEHIVLQALEETMSKSSELVSIRSDMLSMRETMDKLFRVNNRTRENVVSLKTEATAATLLSAMLLCERLNISTTVKVGNPQNAGAIVSAMDPTEAVVMNVYDSLISTSLEVVSSNEQKRQRSS